MKKTAAARVLAALALAGLCSSLAGTTADAAARGPVVVTLALKGRDPAGLDRFLRQVYNPNSTGFHHFLARGEFDRRFGPSPATRQQAVRYMASRGFVTGAAAAASGRLLRFQGTATAARLIASAQELKSVADYVGVPNSWHAVPRLAVGPRLGPSGGFTPTELRTLYQENGALAAGIDGSGQHLAVFELSDYTSNDVTQYDIKFNLTPPAPMRHVVDGGAPVDPQGSAEVALDIEVVNAMAPKAAVDIYIGPNTNLGVLDTYQQIAADDVDSVISSSWGACEAVDQFTAPGFEAAQNQIARQFAAQGQSFFLASGDTGSQACLPFTGIPGFDNAQLNTTDMDGPYTTVVGGTKVTYSGSNLTIAYGSEAVWNSRDHAHAGGGGLSTIYKESDAPWQSGPGVSNPYEIVAGGDSRQVPDAAADADPNTGYSVYFGGWTVFGGTSAAAPLWAGLTALAVEEGHARLGNLNAALYLLFRSASYAQYFHDVSSGDNDVRCPGGSCPNPPDYLASAGFDPATGVGTPRITTLIAALSRLTMPSPTVTPPPTRVPVKPAPSTSPSPLPR